MTGTTSLKDRAARARVDADRPRVGSSASRRAGELTGSHSGRASRWCQIGRLMVAAALIGAAPAYAFYGESGPKPSPRSPSPAARALVERVMANLSAGVDVSRVATLQADGRETVMDLVENDHPLTPPFLTRSIDDVRRAWAFDRRLQRVDTLGNAAPVSTVFLVDDQSITLSGAGNTRKRLIGFATPSWMTRDPIGALRLARSAPDLTMERDVMDHGTLQHVVAFHDGKFPVRILISSATLLPTATEATIALDDQHVPEAIAWNALGDLVERTEYINWSFVGGIRYPLQQDELRNGDLYRSLTISSVKVGVAIDTAEAALKPEERLSPSSVQEFGPATRVPGPYPDKPISEIAPGIIQIPNSWYTTIVRQADGLVIIDAPISAGYSKAVLAEAARRFPGMRVKALISSTGFFWHAAGVREYAARGIPIYPEARNVAVVKRMLAAPHRLVPDTLARVGLARSKVIAITGATRIGTGGNAITIYPVTMATQPMLMSYVADARLLHTGEMVQPLGPGGSILFPESLIELSDTVRARHLVVERMIGMHMSPTPWTAVDATLRAAGVKRVDGQTG